MKKINNFYIIYAMIRHFFQPFWFPKPKRIKKDNGRLSKNKIKEKSKEETLENHERYFTSPKLKIYHSKSPLNIKTLATKLKDESLVYHYDRHKYEILAYFKGGKNARFKYQNERKNNAKATKQRSKFKNDSETCPIFYVGFNHVKGKLDRTHLIPFGYHGSENSNLVVSYWRGDSNKGVIAEFENKVTEKDIELFWYVSIERIGEKRGLRWIGRAYNKHLELIDEIVDEFDIEYKWNENFKPNTAK